MTKERILKIILAGFIAGLVIGLFANNVEKADYIEELETELSETQEQLLISNDQLRLIDARNEADKAIKQMEGEDE